MRFLKTAAVGDRGGGLDSRLEGLVLVRPDFVACKDGPGEKRQIADVPWDETGHDDASSAAYVW